MSVGATESFLSGVAHAYMKFLGEAGAANDRSYQNAMPQLFALTCKKIVNGVDKPPACETREAFAQYLWKAQEVYGKWKVQQAYSVFPSQSTRTVTVNYIVGTTQIQLIVIAILTVDADGLIAQISEVDHELKTI